MRPGVVAQCIVNALSYGGGVPSLYDDGERHYFVVNSVSGIVLAGSVDMNSGVVSARVSGYFMYGRFVVNEPGEVALKSISRVWRDICRR